MAYDSEWCVAGTTAGGPVLEPSMPAADAQLDDDSGAELATVVVAAAGAAALFGALKAYVERTVRRRTADLNLTAEQLRQRVAQGREATHAVTGLRTELAEAESARRTAAEERAELISQLVQLRDVATSEAFRHRIDRALLRVHVDVIGAAGDAFDPDRHVAVGSVPPSADHDADHIVEVVRAGFADRDGSLVRPAEVIVAERASR